MAKTAAKFAYTPAPGRLIVEPLEQKERTDSGIYIPESASKERPQLGRVVALTPGRDKDGKATTPFVSVGDTIVYKKWNGQEVKVDTAEFLILSEEDVLAVQG